MVGPLFTRVDRPAGKLVSDDDPKVYVAKYRAALGDAAYRTSYEENALPYGFEDMDYLEFLRQRRVLMSKMMKWWRREHCPDKRRWPKGITLEKIIADCFPEDSSLYEELMIGVMENIFDSLSEELGDGGVPGVVDPALPTNNLAASYTEEDFRSFVEGLGESLRILQDEGSNNDSWKKVLGNRFPSGSDRAGSRALAKTVFSIQQALSVPHRQSPPWPFTKRRPGVVVVVADVTFEDGHTERISSSGRTIPKGCQIDYCALRSKGLQSLTAKWLVVNTGEEAYAAGCPRGEFEDLNLEGGGRHESTAYSGRHYV